MPFQQQRRHQEGVRDPRQGTRARERRFRRRHGLFRSVRGGSHRHRLSRRRVLQRHEGGRRCRDRGRAPRERQARPASALQREDGRPHRQGALRHQFLQETDPRRPAQLRCHQPRRDRRIHSVRRLSGAHQVPHRAQAAGSHRHHQGVRTARQRRRRFPHRTQMAVRGGEPRPRQVCVLQRRRGRPRRVYGSFHPRRRPTRGAGSHGDRGICDRRASGLHLRQGRVSHRGAEAAHSTRARSCAARRPRS